MNFVTYMQLLKKMQPTKRTLMELKIVVFGRIINGALSWLGCMSNLSHQKYYVCKNFELRLPQFKNKQFLGKFVCKLYQNTYIYVAHITHTFLLSQVV